MFYHGLIDLMFFRWILSSVETSKIQLTESANFKVGTFNLHHNGLIGNRFEMPNVSYTYPLLNIYRQQISNVKTV